MVLTPIIIGLAGCTEGGSPTEGDDSEQDTPTESDDSEQDTPTAPEYEWQKNSPRCSTGDYVFELRGVEIDPPNVIVSIRNTGIESYQLSSISVKVNDDRDTSATRYTDIEIDGGDSESFELDPGPNYIFEDDEVTGVGLSVTALEGEVNDELCWTAD